MSSILHDLRESQVQIAAASRTHTPDLARKALKLLKVPPSADPAEKFFDHLVIYPGNVLVSARLRCREQNPTFPRIEAYDGNIA